MSSPIGGGSPRRQSQRSLAYPIAEEVAKLGAEMSPHAAESEVDGTLAEGMPTSDPPAWSSMHAGAPVRGGTKS